MQIPRFPRYKNKRGQDIYVKAFVDESNLDMSVDWGLPIPNEEAAYKSLAKYAKDIPALSEDQVEDMNLAWEWTTRHFGIYMQNSRVRTVDEVIKALDMSTSSGAPFNSRFPTKRELFEEVPTFNEWLEVDWETLESDPNYTFLFTSSLKEEVRPTEKILGNQIRTFLAGAVDGTVHGNRLFADMNEKMNNSYLRSASGVGMSPYGGNWDRLYRKLNIFKQGYALDESQYDSSLRTYLMWGCALFRWKMLRPEDKTRENLRRIKTYYRNLVNSLIVTAEGVLVFKKGGNPSGSINTINDNTLILYMLLAYAWIRLCKDEPSYPEFENNTAKVLVGDDNTWTVSDWAHEFFNARNVIAEWATIGITTTTDCYDPRPAEELDFLSAHTIFKDGQAIPVYDRTKLMTSLLYAPTLHHTPAVTLTRAAALLTVGWTDTQFRKFCREFIEWLLSKFDATCAEDPDWIMAKCNILNDDRLSQLFLGRTIYIQSAPYSETQERFIKLNKTMSTKTIIVKKSRSRRGKGAKATRRKQGPMHGPERPPNEAARAKRARRRRRMGPPGAIRGRGAYTMNPDDSYGRQWGGYLGSRLGEVVGGAAQGLATTYITGMGEYKVKANALHPGLLPPVYNKNSHGGLVVRGEEYLGDVISSATPGAFSVEGFKINPGIKATFPKLAQTASDYEEYVVEGMFFEFRSMTGISATNPSLGTIVMAANYNSAAPNFTSKVPMEEYDGAVSQIVSKSVTFFLECDRAQTLMDMLLTRTNAVPTGQDPRFFDIANFQVASVGVPIASQNLGELWVSYQVALLKPRLYTSIGNNSYGYSGVTTSWDNTNCFGLVPFANNGNNSSGFGANGNSIALADTPMPLSYIITVGWDGAAATVITQPTFVFANCSQSAVTPSINAPQNGVSTFRVVVNLTVTTVANSKPLISFVGGVFPAPGAAGTCQVSIYQIPNLMTGA